jgi:hypothetical protein
LACSARTTSATGARRAGAQLAAGGQAGQWDDAIGMRTVGGKRPGRGAGRQEHRPAQHHLACRQQRGRAQCAGAHSLTQACHLSAPAIVLDLQVVMKPLAHFWGNPRPTAAMPCSSHLVCVPASQPRLGACERTATRRHAALSAPALAPSLQVLMEPLAQFWGNPRPTAAMPCSSHLVCTLPPPPALAPPHSRSRAAGAAGSAGLGPGHALVLFICLQCSPTHWHALNLMWQPSVLTSLGTLHPPPSAKRTHAPQPAELRAARGVEASSCPSVIYMPTVLPSPPAAMQHHLVAIPPCMHTPPTSSPGPAHLRSRAAGAAGSAGLGPGHALVLFICLQCFPAHLQQCSTTWCSCPLTPLPPPHTPCSYARSHRPRAMALPAKEDIKEADGLVWWRGYAMFCRLTLKAWQEDIKRYPPGVPFLYYAAGAAVWWALNAGCDVTLKELQAQLMRDTVKGYLPPEIFSKIHSSTLLTTKPTGLIQNSTVEDLIKAVLMHLAHNICASHMPVNCKDLMDIFFYPIVAWRLAGVDEDGTPRKVMVRVCLHVKLKHERGVAVKAGDILQYGHTKRYRQIVLGFDAKNKAVAEPIHVLMNILKDGPWKLEENKSALMAREKRLKKHQLKAPRIHCIHLFACQAPGSCHCIGPFCTEYGTRGRNKHMACLYASTVGLRNRQQQKGFAPLPYVTDARNLAMRGPAHRERAEWLAGQQGHRAVRTWALATLAGGAADGLVAAAEAELIRAVAQYQGAVQQAADVRAGFQTLHRAPRGAVGAGRARRSSGWGDDGASTSAAAAGSQMQTRSRAK